MILRAARSFEGPPRSVGASRFVRSFVRWEMNIYALCDTSPKMLGRMNRNWDSHTYTRQNRTSAATKQNRTLGRRLIRRRTSNVARKPSKIDWMDHGPRCSSSLVGSVVHGHLHACDKVHRRFLGEFLAIHTDILMCQSSHQLEGLELAFRPLLQGGVLTCE
jgi:hypothetical protein